jgi:predicted ATPase/DNA-binding SARP family transcriptional activator
MVGADSPPGAQISYRRQYRHCGKATCSRCAAGGLGHGPYWYAFWWEGGRSRSRYVGKHAPPEIDAASWGMRADPAPPPAALSVGVLRVQTLGGFAVWRGETLIPSAAWTSQRAASLFKCLLSAPGQCLRREQVIELLWPETEPTAGKANLRTTIHLLRQVLDDPGATATHLWTQGAALTLAPGGGDTHPDDAWLDASAFTRAARAALAGRDSAACRAALARYTGDYLPDEPYADWAAVPREALRRQYLDLLLHQAALAAGEGGLEEAEDCLSRVLALDPGHEEAAATLMALFASSGRRDAALRVYQALAAALEEELGVPPSAEVAALRARLLAHEAPPMTAPVPALYSGRPRLTNLPIAATTFVGRGWDMAEVGAVLAQARMVTLTGPGGCGKTRLALEVAGMLLDEYADGVWLVELAALSLAALVPQAVRLALGVTEQPGLGSLATLLTFLQPRRLLLILDNCEHLIGACADLAAALLGGCPNLRLLTTSREALGVAGERIYLVPPFAVPDMDHLPPLERLGAYEAVQLFLERARARRPGSTLTETNAASVVEICARLDGLPLAIELAAARVGTLPIESIAARLDHRFLILTGGPRTVLPRQQTLRATLDWSYHLLAPDEQMLLARLAVFAGGCTLTGATAVCGVQGDGEPTMLDGMTSLANKGLLRSGQGAGGEPRFWMLETIRAYATERLEESDAAETVRQRHAAYYLALAEEAEAKHWGPQQRLWLDRLEDEHDNIRAVLRRLLDRGEAESRLRLAFAMWRFWMLHSRLREGSRWLEEVLARGDAAPLLRAKVLYGAGLLAYRRGDHARARALHEEGLTLFRESGDNWGIARSLNQLANVAFDGDGDAAGAQALYSESLRLAEELGDMWLSATVLNNLSLVALYQCDYEGAGVLAAEGLALRRLLGDSWAIAESLVNLARVMLEQGDNRRATTLLQESVQLVRDLGDKRALADCFEALAAARGRRGQPERAARLWAAAETLRGSAGAPLERTERERNERRLAGVRARVAEALWRTAWNEGLTMTPEEAIAHAVSDDADAERDCV